MGNLKTVAVEIYNIIEKHNLDKVTIAKIIYKNEYDQASFKVKSCIIQRFLGKYSGDSDIKESEISAIIRYLKMYSNALEIEFNKLGIDI